MKAQRDGRIVNIIGQAARHPHPDRFPSGVTNAAVMAMTKSVADAVACDNIRVNAVCPQYIESELLASLIAKEMSERNVDRATAVLMPLDLNDRALPPPMDRETKLLELQRCLLAARDALLEDRDASVQ